MNAGSATDSDSDDAPRGLKSAAFPLLGRRHVKALLPLVAQLREQEPHGNRRLFLDDVFLAELLAFFEATVRSLRTIEDFSQSQLAQQYLRAPRIPRSTLSDYHKLADPARIESIIRGLKARLPKQPRSSKSQLLKILDRVQARDGSFFTMAANVVWAVRHASNQGQPSKAARLDVSLNVASWVPELIAVNGKGVSEAQQATATVQPGAIYVYDRGIFSFELIRAQLAVGAFFVHRLRQAGERSPRFEPIESLPLTKRDRQAGVLSDRLGHLAGSTHREAPDAVLREVIIAAEGQPGRQVRLLTNLQGDLAAHHLGLLYRHRWQVELFFRWLKVYAHFDHLISHSPNGILLNFYVAVVGTLLLCLHSGGKPNKYLFNMLSWVASGHSTLEDILPIWRERMRQIEVAKRRQAAKKQKP